MPTETVLITGASSGIGEALAKHFAEGGHDLILVARSEDKLAALADALAEQFKVSIAIEPADLARRGAAKKLFSALSEQSTEVDILVNCAGVLEHGPFIELAAKSSQNMIDLNISGLTSLLGYFLPPMVQRGRGRIMNVASIAAFQPIPTLAVYAATKAFVLSLSESLVSELEGSGVTVTALCPGVTATNMLDKAQQQSEGLSVPGFLVGDVDEVAAQGYRACLKGDAICVPGAVNVAATVTGRATPKWLLRRISGLMARYTMNKN